MPSKKQVAGRLGGTEGEPVQGGYIVTRVTEALARELDSHSEVFSLQREEDLRAAAANLNETTPGKPFNVERLRGPGQTYRPYPGSRERLLDGDHAFIRYTGEGNPRQSTRLHREAQAIAADRERGKQAGLDVPTTPAAPRRVVLRRGRR